MKPTPTDELVEQVKSQLLNADRNKLPFYLTKQLPNGWTLVASVIRSRPGDGWPPDTVVMTCYMTD